MQVFVANLCSHSCPVFRVYLTTQVTTYSCSSLLL